MQRKERNVQQIEAGTKGCEKSPTLDCLSEQSNIDAAFCKVCDERATTSRDDDHLAENCDLRA